MVDAGYTATVAPIKDGRDKAAPVLETRVTVCTGSKCAADHACTYAVSPLPDVHRCGLFFY